MSVRNVPERYGRTTFSDTNYTVTTTDWYVAQVGTLTATRTISLPFANTVEKGHIIFFADESSSVTPLGNTISIVAIGLDQMHGKSDIRESNGTCLVISNGIDTWTGLSGDILALDGGNVSDTALFGNNVGFDQFVSFSNANYSSTPSDRSIIQIGTMSAARTVTLANPSSVPAAVLVNVVDGSGTVTATNKITVAAAGGLTIHGTTDITTAFGSLTFVNFYNGVSYTWVQIASDLSQDKVRHDLLPAALVESPIGVATLPSGSSRTTFNNAGVTITPTDRLIAQVGTMSAQRTATLPAANAVPAGTVLVVCDESGTVTYANDILIARAGADTINGGTVSSRISIGYGYVRLESDGTSNWTVIASSIDVQHYTASGTWTKRPGIKRVFARAIGGGAGGGGGRKGTSAASGGGSGGGTGAIAEAWFQPAELGATETTTVGGSASGGTAQAGAGTDGRAGTVGNASGFGTANALLLAAGGPVGAAGTATGGVAASAVSGQPWAGQSGGSGNTSAGAGTAGNGAAATGLNSYAPGGGGGAGGAHTTTPTNGAAGGIGFGSGGTVGTAGSGSGGGGGNAGNATEPGTSGGGGGGGGAGGTGSVNGGTGGNGGTPGGGGGGGGSCVTGGTSNGGAGGNGARGSVTIVGYF